MSVPKYYQVKTPQGIKSGDPIYYSSRLILTEAEKQGISWRQITGTKVFELKYKNKIKHFYAQIPFSTAKIGEYGCTFKNTTRNLLADKNISIVNAFSITEKKDHTYRQQIFDMLKKPLVLKPNQGTHGDDVFLNVESSSRYHQLIEQIFANGAKKVSVEEMFSGKEYRILATREKVIGIIHRVPANVIGNGKHNVKQLIKIKNQDPSRGSGHEKALLKIRVDKHVRSHLKKQNLSLDYVPQKDEQVFLRANSNLSTGGDSFDVTDQVHPSVKKLAVDVIRAIPGLSLGGIDFMTKDIKSEQKPDNYVIIEVNHSPMISMHDYPYQGKKRDAAKEFLKLLFPEIEE